MNFYFFHIGDYAGATRHLSWDEDLAYRRLMDAYYAREAPLPADRNAIYRLVMASTPKHRQAVDAVLDEFFIELPDGFSNRRCDEELAAQRAKRDKARQSASKRWNSDDALPTHSEGNANAMPTQCEGNAPTTHYPLPSKDLGVGYAGARDPDADLERQLRDAAGWQNEPAPMLAVTGEIQALLDAGAVLEADVLPVVKALGPKARSRTSWKYFVGAIVRARDDRIAALTAVSPQQKPRQDHEPGTRKPRKQTVDFILETLTGGHGEGDPPARHDRAGDEIHEADLAG